MVTRIYFPLSVILLNYSFWSGELGKWSSTLETFCKKLDCERNSPHPLGRKFMGKSMENIYTDIRVQRVKKMLGNFTSLFLTPKSQLLLLQGWLHCVNASKQFPSYPSPLDDLINQLGGPKKVAEMTGRRGRVVKTEKQPHPHYEARESDNSNVDSLNIQEVREQLVPVSHWPKRHDCFLRWIAIMLR